MSVVSLSFAISFSLSAITWSALFGSSAAVCSSSSSNSGLRHAAINRVSACRCPPERLPIALSSRSSRPMLSCRTASRMPARTCSASAKPSPRLNPRRAARAKFSAMERFGAVPLKGF